MGYKRYPTRGGIGDQLVGYPVLKGISIGIGEMRGTVSFGKDAIFVREG